MTCDMQPSAFKCQNFVVLYFNSNLISIKQLPAFKGHFSALSWVLKTGWTVFTCTKGETLFIEFTIAVLLKMPFPKLTPTF